MCYISTKYKHRIVYNHIKDTKFHQFTTGDMAGHGISDCL